MRYVRGIVVNGAGSRKHAETCRRGQAKHPEEQGLGPEKRLGNKAENCAEAIEKMFDLVHLHFLACCEAFGYWRVVEGAEESRLPITAS